MTDIKFGINQTGNPAPKGWRQFERAFIIGIAPALLLFVQSWGFTDATANKLLVGITFLTSLIKSIGMFLSNGESYVETASLTTEQKDSQEGVKKAD